MGSKQYQYLLALYFGLFVINVVLSSLLWRQQRTRLSRSLFFVWTATLLGTFAQGLIVGSAFVTTLGFATVFVLNLALADLLTGISTGRVPWRASAVVFVAGLTVSAVNALLGLPFWAVALPTGAGVAFPVLYVGGRLLWTRPVSLSLTGKALTLSCMAFGLHCLDFAFLRNRPELAMPAFTVGIFILFSLSVTAPAGVLETVARARAEAEQSRIQAEETKRIQSEFFANVSHELRTPLTLILTPLEAILQDHARDLSASAQSYLRSMQRNAARLLRLINNLLDLSRLSAGKVFLRYEPVELSMFLKDLLPPFAALAERRGIPLELEGGTVTPVQVDAEKVDIIFQNLLGNALKFTEQGAVTVRIGEDKRHVSISVSDTGTGIAEKDQAKIFDRFAQADGSATRRFGGSGIGLALVRELVDLHGGSIEVDSQVGAGTTFTVRFAKGEEHIREEIRDRRAVDLPVLRERRESGRDAVGALVAQSIGDALEEIATTDGTVHALPEDAARVLVVEDNPDLRLFLAKVIGRQHRVSLAEDGEEGLEKATAERPDLVLSDVMMPKLSGYDLTRRIKSDRRTSQIPVILLTAKRGIDPRLEGFAHGADDYVGKPFSTRELLARINVQLKLRDLGQQLAQAEKTRVLSTLAAGLAHEIRNPINAIVNAVPVLRRHAPDPAAPASAANAELLEIIEQSASRIDGMVEDLLTFTNLDRAEINDWDPHGAVDSTLKLLDPRGAEIRVTKDYRFPGTIEGRPQALNQVLMSVLDNAFRAVGESGTVHVRTEPTAKGLRIEVADDGPGIPADILPRVFDAYFTTRDVGVGTGLGLHLSRQIINGHGGAIVALSTEGQGTTLRIDLPHRLATGEADAGNAEAMVG